MKKLIECVPNFSEGNDMHIIDQITDAMKTVEGISVIDVDPGKATNRTVVTMVGEPICEAAFRAVKKAAELIDMTKHKGAHPRFGATDVCPLVPVSNITMEETVEYARKLAERIGKELNIPVIIFADKTGRSQTISVFLVDHGVGEKMAVELLRQPKGLLVGQGIGVVQPPAGNVFKGTQTRFEIEGPETPDEIFDFFRGGRRRERDLTHFVI